MIIEKLKMEDIPELLSLYQELIPEKTDLDVAQSTYREILNNDNYAIFVVKLDNKIVGSALGICCQSLTFQDKNFLVIEDVIVSETVRGKGIGKDLFHKLDEFALEHNCAYAILVSSDHRLGAHAFYEKLGYTDGVKGFRKIYDA